MLPFAGVASADFLEPVQNIVHKVEVWDGAAWQNLCELGGSGGKNYLKTISLSLAGAALDIDPVAGSWSATLDNENGIFHPQHPTSVWAGLLTTGREVRISVGGVYAGVEHFYQRMIGFMDEPVFNHGSKTVELSGVDYMRLLTDTELRDDYGIDISGSGSSGDSDFYPRINGPTHRGSYVDLDSVESEKVLGAELYTNGDAMDPAAEANNMTNWDEWDAYSNVASVADAGAGSTWAGQFEHIGDTTGTINAYFKFDTGIAVTTGDIYFIDFDYKGQYIGDTFTSLEVAIYKTPGGGWPTEIIWGVTGLNSDGAWSNYSSYFTATQSCNLTIKVTVKCRLRRDGVFRIDNFSLKKVSSYFNQRYILPDLCNGPYFVTIDGDPIWQGFDEGSGWHYDENGRLFWIDDAIPLNDGTNNIRVYFYTDQIIENVVADLMAFVGLYANRAAALADMDYTPTGVTIPRVFFNTGSAAIDAITLACERVNYRFYFEYDGKPNFNPLPAATAVDFAFTEPGHIRDLSEQQERKLIRNRIVIEGIQRAMYPVSREDKTNDRWKGEASDTTSITTYLEKTKTISNHLFQDQASCDAIAAAILAALKDPKWYDALVLFANPVPLEMGDVVSWWLELEPTTMANVDSGAVRVQLIGIIRDIKINDSSFEYKVEVTALSSGSSGSSGSVAPSGSVTPSASLSPSASASEFITPSGTPESGVEQTETILGNTSAEGNWIVPTGVYWLEIDGWGHGGGGGPSGEFESFVGGGGGGGGAFSHTALAVTPGESLHYIIGPSGHSVDTYTEVWRNWGLPGAVCILRADYGGSTIDNTYGDGGAAATGIGDLKYSGGHGAVSASTSGGGGGSSAGTAANGNNATTRAGAFAPAGGGAGGYGGLNDTDGNPGSNPGGGGGGSGYDAGSGPVAGDGADGKIVFRWWE